MIKIILRPVSSTGWCASRWYERGEKKNLGGEKILVLVVLRVLTAVWKDVWQRGGLGTQVSSLHNGFISLGQEQSEGQGEPNQSEWWTARSKPPHRSFLFLSAEGLCGWWTQRVWVGGGKVEGSPLAKINGPVVWFSIFLGCVYYLLQRPWLSDAEVGLSNVVALHDNWIDGALRDSCCSE